MLSLEKINSVCHCIPIGLITMDYMANTQNTPTNVSVRSLCIVSTCFWDVAPHKHNWTQRSFTDGIRLIHLLMFSLLFFSTSVLSLLFSSVFVFLVWFWVESRDLMRRFWWAKSHRSWSWSRLLLMPSSKDLIDLIIYPIGQSNQSLVGTHGMNNEKALVAAGWFCVSIKSQYKGWW